MSGRLVLQRARPNVSIALMVHVITRAVRLTIVTLTFLCATASFAAPRLPGAELQLIRLVCHHSVVLLGENGHGDGATIAIRAKLVPELVRRCGFSAIVFESSYYDFAELARTTSPTDHYDRQKLLSAVGGIWSPYSEFFPLADWLTRQSPSKLAIAGIDDQIGMRGAFYSLTGMPAQLSALSAKEDRAKCQSLFALSGWRGLNPNAQHVQRDLCLVGALGSLAGRNDYEARHLRAMAEAFRRANARSSLVGDEYVAARDQAMADNLDAFRKSLPRGTKILVWTANSHAAIGGYGVGKPLGQIARARYGSDVFSVGFSAAGGQYRWSRTEVRDVPEAPANSLETQILRGRASAVAANGRLASLGVISGAALSWHKMITADWSKLFDAVFVLSREKPTTRVENE